MRFLILVISLIALTGCQPRFHCDGDCYSNPCKNAAMRCQNIDLLCQQNCIPCAKYNESIKNAQKYDIYRMHRCCSQIVRKCSKPIKK